MAFASCFVCFFLSLLLIIVQGKGRNDSTCPTSFSCGNVTNLSFPLSLSTQSECGIMSMSGCNAKPYPRIQLLPGGDSYYATQMPYYDALHLVDLKLRTTFRKHKCQALNKNISSFIPDSPSISFKIISPNIRNFLKCNSIISSNITGFKKMHSDCKGFSIYYQPHTYEHSPTGNLTANCSLIRLPIRWGFEGSNILFKLLSYEYTVEWKVSDDCNDCHYGGGQCLTDKTNKFHCHKDEKINRSILGTSDKIKLRLTLGAVSGGVGLMMIVCLLLYCIWCRKRRKFSRSRFLSTKALSNYFRQDAEGGSIYFGVPVFPYSELEEATNDFNSSRVLGCHAPT